jgi:hypothetical protein
MRKVFDWLDNRRFPGDWAIADMIKQFLRGRRRQITKKEKLSREAELEGLAKERRRRQEKLQKRTVLAEDDPESVGIEETNNEVDVHEDDSNLTPARPKKNVMSHLKRMPVNVRTPMRIRIKTYVFSLFYKNLLI